MGFAQIALFVLFALVFFPQAAFAEAGIVYGCDVHPVYEHPVTGEIEDSGGESARATGQAMVDSCVSGAGMMEVTDAGASYLTIRLGLMDLTSNHAFQVQGWGDSGWSNPAMGVTATGSDANGTTNDVCIELPSEDGIVRVSMFVDSMGRDVVFYVYADGFSEGVPDGFTPTIVTESAADDPESEGGEASEAPSEEAAPDAGGQAEAAEGAGTSEAAGAAGQAEATGEAEVAGRGDPGEVEDGEDRGAEGDAGSGGESGNGGWSSVGAGSDGTASAAAAGAGAASSSAAPEAAAGSSAAASSADETSEELVASAGGSSDQGLSLSTADDPAVVEAAGQASGQPAFNLPDSDALWSIVALEVIILVPMVVAAFIVYLFRRNWKRWGGEDDDNYSKAYRDEML